MIISPDPFLRYFKTVRALRRRRALGYLMAAAGVAIAAVLRLSFGGALQAVTFTSFYPAIFLATLVGGARAGVFSIALSALAANGIIMAPMFSLSNEVTNLTAMGLFIAVAGLQVALVALLYQEADRIWQQAEQTKLILESQSVGVMLVDENGIINFVNSIVEDEVGYSPDELRGRRLDVLVPEAFRDSHNNSLRRYMAAPNVRRMGTGRELRMQHKGGALIPVEVGLSPFHWPGFSGALASIVNISERKALERREIIAGEIRHRARNLLTVVQILARRTLPREECAAFTGMLEAIARTQDVVNAQASASLRAIVESELAKFAHRVTDEGGDVRLSTRAAQDFALIVHELTTNALKHGALSRPEGRVEIAWRREADERSFSFLWEERGGPEVSVPVARGFGSTILKDLALGIANSVEADYAHEGFRYQLRAELARIGEVVEAAETVAAT